MGFFRDFMANLVKELEGIPNGVPSPCPYCGAAFAHNTHSYGQTDTYFACGTAVYSDYAPYRTNLCLRFQLGDISLPNGQSKVPDTFPDSWASDE